MEGFDLLKLLAAVRDGGSTALLLLAVVGGFRGWYVWSWHYKEILAREALWQALYFKAIGQAEKLVGTVEKVI